MEPLVVTHTQRRPCRINVPEPDEEAGWARHRASGSPGKPRQLRKLAKLVVRQPSTRRDVVDQVGRMLIERACTVNRLTLRMSQWPARSAMVVGQGTSIGLPS